MRRNKLFLIVIIFVLLCVSAALVNGCNSRDVQDDDDDDNDDAGDDDNADFQCGEDMECHEDYADCLIDCDTLDCPANVCNPAYRECLDPNGCTLPYLDCKDACGEDDDACRDECEGDYASCFAAECNADEQCLTTCFDAFDACTDECGATVGCYLGCLNTYDGCIWGCLP